MLELAQHIQVFLHKHNRPPVSLYEEMVERQRAEERRERERKEKERQLSRIKDQGGGTGTTVGGVSQLGMKQHCTCMGSEITHRMA